MFDSRAERDLSRSLARDWNLKLRLMAQMPLRTLIEFDAETRKRLESRYWRYFLQAAVDYTFVHPDGCRSCQSSLTGLGGGYGHGRRYLAAVDY